MIFSVDGHIDKILKGTKTETRRIYPGRVYKIGYFYSVQPGRGGPGIPEGKIKILSSREEQRKYPISLESAAAEGGYTPTAYEQLFEGMHPGWEWRTAYRFKFVPVEEMQRIRFQRWDKDRGTWIPINAHELALEGQGVIFNDRIQILNEDGPIWDARARGHDLLKSGRGFYPTSKLLPLVKLADNLDPHIDSEEAKEAKLLNDNEHLRPIRPLRTPGNDTPPLNPQIVLQDPRAEVIQKLLKQHQGSMGRLIPESELERMGFSLKGLNDLYSRLKYMECIRVTPTTISIGPAWQEAPE